MNPAIFPHRVHWMKYSCRVYHGALGFKMKARASTITMRKIFQSEYCAKCHNGKVAFDTSRCQTCHSGLKGLFSQVHRSTSQSLVSPPEIDVGDMFIHTKKSLIPVLGFVHLSSGTYVLAADKSIPINRLLKSHSDQNRTLKNDGIHDPANAVPKKLKDPTKLLQPMGPAKTVIL